MCFIKQPEIENQFWLIAPILRLHHHFIRLAFKFATKQMAMRENKRIFVAKEHLANTYLATAARGQVASSHFTKHKRNNEKETFTVITSSGKHGLIRIRH